MVGHADARKCRGDLQPSLVVFTLTVDFWLSPPYRLMQKTFIDTNNDGRETRSAAQALDATAERYVLRVDCSERNAALLDLARLKGHSFRWR